MMVMFLDDGLHRAQGHRPILKATENQNHRDLMKKTLKHVQDQGEEHE